MNKKTSRTHLFSLLPLYSVTFIGFIGYSLMLTLFTPLMMDPNNGFIAASADLSVRVIILGVLLALYPFGQFFGSPIMGALSDHFGRKGVLIISLCVTTLCYLLIAFALVEKNLILLMIGSLIAGLSEANIVITQSAIADVSDPKDRSRLFGYICLSASASYIVGPLLGGKLAAYNLVLPFWCVIALLIITILWTWWVFHETKPPSEGKINYLRTFINLTQIFTHKRLRIYYLVNFLIYLAIFGFFRSYPMYLVNEFNMNVSRLSEFIAWVAVPIILSNIVLTGWAAKYFSPKRITITSAIATGIFMLIIIIPNRENALWITLFLTGLALALCLPACSALLSMTASESEQGSAMGNNQAMSAGAEAISGLVGGLLAAWFIKFPLIVMGILAIIAGIILLFVKPKSSLDRRSRRYN